MKRTIALLALALVMMVGAARREALATLPDYAADVKFANGDATPDAATSKIDDYTYQREDLKLDTSSGAVRVLRTNQKVMLNDFVTVFFPLKKATPRELRGPFRAITRKEGGDADVLHDNVKKEYFLQVTCPQFQVPYLEKAAEALDEDWLLERKDGSAELYTPMKFRDAAKVLNITKYYRSSEGVFNIDKSNNAIYYRDEVPLLALQKRGYKEVDIPPSQMMLDVAIYEVASANDLLLGTDFVSWKKGPGRKFFDGMVKFSKGVADQTPFTGDSTHTSKDSRYAYGSFNAAVVASYVDFLQVKGKAKLLNRAQVTAKSGSSAVISAQDELVTFNRTSAPLPVTATAQQTVTVSGPIAADGSQTVTQTVVPAGSKTGVPADRNATYIDASGKEVSYGAEYTAPGYRAPTLDYAKNGTVGVKVEIVPSIGQKSSEVQIKVDLSDVTGFTPSGMPIIKSRQVDSKARLFPGEPYVIAGLTRKSTLSATGKFPILGSIPVLGWLFGHETESSSESQVVIVLKPDVSLSSESALEMPEAAKTVKSIVESANAYPAIPDTAYGFDQWLLDSQK